MKTISIKLFIIFIFVSGVMQLDILNISWETYSFFSVTHLIASIVLSLFILIPFVNKHAYKYIFIKQINSINGWILGVVFLLLVLSGFYLFLIGNPGGDTLGIIAFNIHKYGAFVLIIQFLYHIRNSFSLHSKAVASMIIMLCTYLPISSYANGYKHTNIKLENNKTDYHIEDWTNSAKCQSCHSDIFKQWANSNHKNMTEANPYYMVMEGIAAEEEGEEFRQWCMGCHNPSGLTTGLTRSSHPMDENLLANTLFEKDGKRLIKDFKEHGNIRLEEGVSCLMCHRISKATSQGNASYTLDLTNQKKYPFETSDLKVGHFLSEKLINAKPEVHKQSYSNKLYKQSKYCASCHDETSPTTGKQLVSTYKEWEASPYNDPENPSKHKTCIDCHMTYLQDNKFSPLAGTSTTGGLHKKDIKVHYFAGSNHFLAGLKSKKNEDQIIQLLKTSAKLDLTFTNNKLEVGVKNIGAGHHLPTGVSDFRQLWLEVTVKDNQNNIVYRSGYSDKEGYLEKNSRLFMKVFGDENKKPVGLLFWKYKTLLKDTRIKAKERRVEEFNLPKVSKSLYPLTVTVNLNFRIYPQWVTNLVQKSYPALPNPTIITLNSIEKIIHSK